MSSISPELNRKIVWRARRRQFRRREFKGLSSEISKPSRPEPMERVANHLCPRCGRLELNVYFSCDADEKIGAWCENCDLKGYFKGDELVSVDVRVG